MYYQGQGDGAEAARFDSGRVLLTLRVDGAGMTVMKLKTRVWHGYYHEKGETVTPYTAPQGLYYSDITDQHGCRNLWVIDKFGNLMNVWECEVSV